MNKDNLMLALVEVVLLVIMVAGLYLVDHLLGFESMVRVGLALVAANQIVLLGKNTKWDK